MLSFTLWFLVQSFYAGCDFTVLILITTAVAYEVLLFAVCDDVGFGWSTKIVLVVSRV
jgi:hypothetical protein